jgi:hypothetical protein
LACWILTRCAGQEREDVVGVDVATHATAALSVGEQRGQRLAQVAPIHP